MRGPDHAIVDFRFSYLNSNAEKLIAMQRDNVLGQLLTERLPMIRDTDGVARYTSVVDGGLAINEEVCFKRRTGDIWLQTHIIKLDDGVAITARDIT